MPCVHCLALLRFESALAILLNVVLKVSKFLFLTIEPHCRNHSSHHLTARVVYVVPLINLF